MNLRELTLFIIVIAATGLAKAETAVSPLFDDHSVLELSFTVDFDELCRPSKDPDCDFTPTVLEFSDQQGQLQSVPVEIRRRDGWRALHTNCQIPTLFMRFPPDGTAGTPFEGQTTLALTSHCGKGISQGRVDSPTLPSRFESYVISEYLGYRLYNLFTDASLRVRLARITYKHPEEPRKNLRHDAFFAEHFESLARRLDATLLDEGSFDPERIDRSAAQQLAVFQYMIGNTDWSLENQDNIILLRDSSGRDIPVLFDLDQAGLVNAHYARPAGDLPIQTVRQRYFMGSCMPDQELEQVFERFSGKRTEVLTMLSETPGLGRGDRRMAGVFLDGFFDAIDSPSGQDAIVRTCHSSI